MERDKIIKALECFHQRILDTDLAEKITETEMMAFVDALALIKELTEENEAAIDDLERCMHYADPKSANTCNFCIHDCEVSKDGTRCKGKDDRICCTPVWRGVVKSKSEGE